MPKLSNGQEFELDELLICIKDDTGSGIYGVGREYRTYLSEDANMCVAGVNPPGGRYNGLMAKFELANSTPLNREDFL
jgi:hypothetical protein